MTSNSLFSAFSALFRRDLRLMSRSLNDIFNPLVFFLMVVCLLPLGLGPDREVLASLAPGLLWIIALLSVLLSLDGLFTSDYEDGSLEQLVLSPYYLYFLSLSKVLAHWLLTGVPLALISPLLGVLLSLPAEGLLPLLVSLLLGTAILSLIGAIGSALTVSLRNAGVLISLVILPLTIPVLIFGSSCVKAGVSGEPITGLLAILGAFLCLALILAPVAIAGALKLNIRQ